MIRWKLMTGLLVMLFFVSVNAQDAQQRKNDVDDDEKYEAHYKKTADELALNLKARINLDDAQTSAVRDILIDYNRRVWGIKYNLTPGSPDVVTDVENPDNDDRAAARPGSDELNQTPSENKQDEFKGTVRDNDSISYYAGLGRMQVENLRNADREADQEIVEALEPAQREKFMDVKVDWWAVVKDRVHNTTFNQNLHDNMNRRDNQPDNQNDADKKLDREIDEDINNDDIK